MPAGRSAFSARSVFPARLRAPSRAVFPPRSSLALLARQSRRHGALWLAGADPLLVVSPGTSVLLRGVLAYGGGGARLRAVILIVAGVSGSGKTTVGALVAGRLRWRFADADTFHPEANVAKMRSGIPLTDEDRAPWLRAIVGWMDAQIADGQSAVVTCSALKRAYRDELLAGRPAAMMVFLVVSDEILAQRVAARPEHFFPGKLLESQLADARAAGSRMSGCASSAKRGTPRRPRRRSSRCCGRTASLARIRRSLDAVKLTLDLHDIYNRGGEIEKALQRDLRRGRREEGADDRDHPRQGIGPAEEARAAVP